MENDTKIEFLKTVSGCTYDEAQLALAISENDEQKALSMVDLIRQRYLVIKVYFNTSGLKSIQGLFFTILDEMSSLPIYTMTLVINYSDEPMNTNMNADVIYFHQLITANRKEQNRYNIESSIELKEYIEGNFIPEPAHKIWNTVKELNSSPPAEENSPQVDRTKELEKNLLLLISQFLEDHFRQSLNVKFGIELLNKLRFQDLAKGMGLTSLIENNDKNTDEAGSAEKKSIEEEMPVIVTVKGKGVIDISGGILARDLRKGDKIAVDITERSDIAENLARMLGINTEGYWLHTWGVVTDIRNLEDGRRRVIVEIARNIFVDCIFISEMLIKCRKRYPGGSRSEFIMESPSTVPGYLMVAGMALFFGLLMKIFMIIMNR
jgi:hypothetical protein